MLSTRVSSCFVLLVLAASAAAATLDAQVPVRRAPRGGELLTPAPTNVKAQLTPAGVLISWEGVAQTAQYVVVRAPGVGAPGTPIGRVAATALSFVDQGFNAPAAYQVIAVMANGSTGQSAMVPYAPPAGRPVAVADPRPAPPPPPPPPPPPLRTRRITSVEQTVIRSGGRFKIHGEGFKAAGYETEVTGAYFGTGVPATMTNQRYPIVGQVSDTYLEIITTPACNQTGLLMVASPGVGGATESWTGATPPIFVTCASSTPSGRIIGSEGTANGVMAVSAGTMVTIEGTNLSLVTRVLDGLGTAYPFTVLNNRLSFAAPAVRPGGTDYFSFILENKLTDPVANSVVTGAIRVLSPPTWSAISPGWAEPGQKVTLSGKNLSYGRPPTVTVGGVAAQVLSFDATKVEVRLGPATTAGPIVLQAEGGSVPLTGAFPVGDGSSHPGFFVVAGPSVVQGVQIIGDTIVVSGQNLARLRGICVQTAGVWAGGQPKELTPAYASAMAKSNTVMLLRRWDVPQSPLLSGSAVMLSAPMTQPYDFPPTQFACTANGANVPWP